MKQAKRRSAILILVLPALLVLLPQAGIARPQEPPATPQSAAQPPVPAEQEKDQAEDGISLTVAKVIAMLRAGTPAASLIRLVEGSNVLFDLTIEDAIHLRKLGAPAKLVRLLARGGEPAPQATAATPAGAPEQPSPDALTVKKVMRMHHKGVPADELAGMIASRGLKEPADLDQLLQYRADGVPAVLILAMAGAVSPEAAAAPAAGPGQASPAPAASETAPKGKPLKVSEIRRMLEDKQEPASIAATIARRGIREPLTLDEAIEMRRLGATDEVLAAINEATVPAQPGEVEAPEEEPAGPGSAGSAAAEGVVPPPEGADTFAVFSVPPGLGVYVAPSRTRIEESLRHGYRAGRTPLALTLAPGDYNVIVQKEAGELEAGLVPAWRTMQDAPGTRSILDNADLTFDPASCCLPGSVGGTVELHPVPEDQSRQILGDEFGGLPPYLFDGEALQILRVRRSLITHAMKLYHVRKTAGQPRLLVASFVPAEGDPLDTSAVPGVPAGSPFESYLSAPELDYLGTASGQAALALALGVETNHLGSGVAMLRRAGKAIIHQQFDADLRLLTLALDYNGRLRVTDQTIHPVDPFASARAAAKIKKKKKPAIPPPPPPLPGLERTVVPGLGPPRLVLDNTTKQGIALLFGDGQFCFVPSSTSREFVIDPGTFDVRALWHGAIENGPQGRLHFSYHARYTMTFR